MIKLRTNYIANFPRTWRESDYSNFFHYLKYTGRFYMPCLYGVIYV